MILALNIDRRHLDAGQRAVFALRYERYYADAVPEPVKGEAGKYVPAGETEKLDSAERPWERQSTAKAARATGKGTIVSTRARPTEISPKMTGRRRPP